MNIFLVAGASFLGCFGALVLFVFCAARGDIGDLVAKAADNIKGRMIQPLSYRGFYGSPAGAIWPSDWWRTAKGGIFFAGMAALLTLLQNLQAQTDPTSYLGAMIAGLVGTAIVAVQRWLTNNPR